MLSRNGAQISVGQLKLQEVTFLRLFPLIWKQRHLSADVLTGTDSFLLNAAVTSQKLVSLTCLLYPATIGPEVRSSEKAWTGQLEVVKRLLILPSAEGGFYLKCVEMGIPKVNVELVEKMRVRVVPNSRFPLILLVALPFVSVLLRRDLPFWRRLAAAPLLKT